ncbi:MAG: amidohydrolase family protein [Ginsengibacter sp.]
MKKLVMVVFVLILATKNYAQDIIIRDINIIPMTSDTLIANKSVLIRHGKIMAIEDYKTLPKNKQTKIINGKGKYLMPGLADMHVHLPEENKIEKLLLANIAAGITQIRIMNSVDPQLEIRERLSKKEQLISPNIHYSHLITSSETFTEPEAELLMQQLIKEKITFIKLLSLSDETTFDNLTEAANKNNVTICGHYPLYKKDGKSVAVDIEKTIKSNYKSIEHLAGYTWLQNEDQLDKAIQLTKEYNIYNCPTMDWHIMVNNMQYPADYKKRISYQFLPKKMTRDWESEYAAFVEKAGGKEKVIASRDKSKASFDLKLKVLKKLYDNDCLLLVGSDPGNTLQANGFNVYEEMIDWSDAGIDNYTILKSATVNPSRFFNESDKWGTIESGKNADIIILEKNPLTDIKNITSIKITMAGTKMYNNNELIKEL